MNIFVFSSMIISTLYAIGEVTRVGKSVKVNGTECNSHLTKAGCISIAAIATGFNIAGAWLLINGV